MIMKTIAIAFLLLSSLIISDYKNWLDNISTGDTRATAYIMDKVILGNTLFINLNWNMEFFRFLADLSAI